MAAIQSWHCVSHQRESCWRSCSVLDYHTHQNRCAEGDGGGTAHISDMLILLHERICVLGKWCSLSVILQSSVLWRLCRPNSVHLLCETKIVNIAMWTTCCIDSLVQDWLSTALCWTTTCNTDIWNGFPLRIAFFYESKKSWLIEILHTVDFKHTHSKFNITILKVFKVLILKRTKY